MNKRRMPDLALILFELRREQAGQQGRYESPDVEVITNRLGHSRLLEYDDRGNLIRELDELQNETRREFDDNDRLLSETDPLENKTTYTYDAQGNLRSMTDPEQSTTSFTYNDRGQLLTTTDY